MAEQTGEKETWWVGKGLFYFFKTFLCLWIGWWVGEWGDV